MIATLITTTPKASMQSLAFQGIMVYASYPQIRDMLLRRFGDEYALLFARPEENAKDGNIDWYSPVQGDAKKLLDLPEEERGAICATIESMANEIRNFAEELIQSREPLKVTRGNILKLALRYPDENAIYVIGKQPVVTCWGFAPGTSGVEGCNLTRLAPGARPQPAPQAPPPPAAPARVVEPAPVAAAASRPWNWWWLLPLLPLLLLLLLLFTSFGPIPALSGNSLINLPSLPFFAEERDDSGRISQLEAEINGLRSDLAKRAAMCAPEKSEPRVQAAPSRPAAPVRPENREELVIPEKADDASFMEGQWTCDTGLANMRTGEPVAVTFIFGKDGRGKGVIFERNDRCEGNALAEMRGGVLHIRLDEQKCRNSSISYQPVTIDCDNANAGGTVCRGINQDGSRWDANFYREK